VKNLYKYLAQAAATGAAVVALMAMTAFPTFQVLAAIPSPTDAGATAIQTTYDAITVAFDNDRIGQIPTFLTEDYTETDPHGQILDQAAAIKKLRDERNQIDSVQSQWSIVSITNSPTGMMVQLKLHSEGTGSKRIAFFKIRGTFTNDMVCRDWWIDTADGWRIKSRVKLLDDSHVQAG